MFEDIEHPDWSELFKIWQYSCQTMNPSITKSLNIIEIKVDSPGWDWRGEEYIDWWPNEVIDRRINSIKEHGVRGLYFWEKTKAGTRTTAELLWNLRNDMEGMALTWIGASMWDKKKNLPDFWRGKIYRRIELLLNEIIKQLHARNMYTWHHSSRDALPITIHDKWFVSEALKPSNYEDLVGIASIESVLTFSNWTIVRLIAQ